MSPIHTFRLTGHWQGPDNGLLQAESVHAPLPFSAPVEFQGQPGFWTPEHLLLSAISGCFLTTLRAIADRSKMEFLDMKANVEGDVSHEADGWQFTKLRLQAHVAIRREEDRGRAVGLVYKAERACIISRAIRVPLELTCSVEVSKEVPTGFAGKAALELAMPPESRHDSAI